MRIVPTAPFAPVPLLFLAPPRDSEFYTFLQEVHRIVAGDPTILAAIDADLDLHGQRKKALRIADAQWNEAQHQPLPTIDHVPQTVATQSLLLGVGRPRTEAYVVYLFLIGRGFFGGFKSSEGTTLMLESVTLRVFLANQGLGLPGRSTLTELVNAISAGTREKILDAQLRAVLSEGWDDCKTLTQDSTAVEGNVLWPTDSRLMVDLVARLCRRGGRLDIFGLPNFGEPRTAKVLGAMSLLDRDISLGLDHPKNARSRRLLYRKLLKKAHRATALLAPQVERTQQALRELDVLPSLRVRAERLVKWLETDLENLRRVVLSCEARILRGEKVPVGEKVLSVSDPDAGFIAKGGREPVVGYKPQLARSGNGFITGLIVPQGNASDSCQLVPMFDQVVRRTGVIPDIVSVDDGYSSALGRTTLQTRGAKVVSISGSKGKKITSTADWDSEAYAVARDNRSAVESLMFTIKYGFDFGRVARRGLENVQAELLEKVLAYNFCRLAACRHAADIQEAWEEAQAA
ncbi:MAG: transposase [Chloroflexi bacterium]|nr:transposase [Chloroflexota bacterium]